MIFIKKDIMKRKELLKKKKIKILINETQFRALAENVLNEQEKQTIKMTHLIKL
jgi:uncharacterized glyoxalase superfamily metalloenzyme YdcJ